MVRTALALMLSTLVLTTPVRAAETEETTPVADAAIAAVTAPAPEQARVFSRSYRAPARTPLLSGLYVSLGALQAYDAYSTVTALKLGAVEANPLMQGVAQNALLFTAVKAGVTGATILAAEQLWKNHKKTQAILLMVASNGLMAYVAHNNAGVLRSLR
jgi:hypothetical protein